MNVGRNDPCPCGSGKKFKHCCLAKPGGRALTGIGTCSGPGDDRDGKCGRPGSGALTCKICGKLYAHCVQPDHQSTVAQLMHGHVMRAHPETIPPDRFDKMLKDEAVMADFRSKSLAAPDYWRAFFEYVEERQSGRPRTASERAAAVTKTIVEQGKRHRAKALETPDEMVRWYDGAWEFLLSHGSVVPMWGFSASLYPSGRGSTENDWKRLGLWAHAVGVPDGDREIGRTIDTVPNAVHKWMWMESEESAGAKPSSSHVEAS
jgi:hypothetical protein